ncbi:MAG TPA: hypothetical protein VHF00_04850 [Acidimicrobiales bacterium]|jgi:hypothetical protein|nr:hypothetical protein [Acidimicrobiales bacterium]
MRLRGREGNELALSIVGYQFPDETVDPWDSNGLLVSVRVVTPHGTWEVVDPCLTTWEARQLALWLAAIARGAMIRPTSTLSEPNLTARVSIDPLSPTPRFQLRVCFELENRPPWAPTVAGGRNLCVDLDVGAADLAAAAAAVREDLARFPQRGDDPTL